MSALKADPGEAARIAQTISNWPRNSANYFPGRPKSGQGSPCSSEQLGIFANAYWGHPAYKLPPEVNLIGVAHYLDALEWQKEIVKVHRHPGRKESASPLSRRRRSVFGHISKVSMALNAERLAFIGKLIGDGTEFVEQVYLPYLLAVAGFYRDWFAIGGGLENYLAYGDLPTNGINDPSHFKFPRGADSGAEPGRGPGGQRRDHG